MEVRADIQHGNGSSKRTPRWREIAESPEFRRLERTRRRLVLTFLGVFSLGLGSFLILSAYARPFMRESVTGGLTVAYVWLLALTVLAWIIAWAYLRVSERWLEPLARRIAERAPYAGSNGGGGARSGGGAQSAGGARS
jgi:uncharacterized membrane protein (DUF485 family)